MLEVLVLNRLYNCQKRVREIVRLFGQRGHPATRRLQRRFGRNGKELPTLKDVQMLELPTTKVDIPKSLPSGWRAKLPRMTWQEKREYVHRCHGQQWKSFSVSCGSGVERQINFACSCTLELLFFFHFTHSLHLIRCSVSWTNVRCAKSPTTYFEYQLCPLLSVQYCPSSTSEPSSFRSFDRKIKELLSAALSHAD